MSSLVTYVKILVEVKSQVTNHSLIRISVPVFDNTVKQIGIKAVQQQDARSDVSQESDGDRSALLDSIRNFKAGQLKKAVTVDKSVPRV